MSTLVAVVFDDPTTAFEMRTSLSQLHSRLRTNFLREDEHVPGLQVGMGACESGRGAAYRQAAVIVAPGVERQCVVIGVQNARVDSFEYRRSGCERGLLVIRCEYVR